MNVGSIVQHIVVQIVERGLSLRIQIELRVLVRLSGVRRAVVGLTSVRMTRIKPLVVREAIKDPSVVLVEGNGRDRSLAVIYCRRAAERQTEQNKQRTKIVFNGARKRFFKHFSSDFSGC